MDDIRKNWGLDVVRSLAIVLVLVSHGRTLLPDFALKGHFSAGGFFGVEVFFVLSGYLIGGILIRKLDNGLCARDLREFWVRRWLRTMPLYFVMLGVNLAINPQGFSWHYLFFIQNFITPCPGFMPESWSLVVEEWFYFLFSVGILLFQYAGLVGKRALNAAIYLFILLPLLMRIWLCFQDPATHWDSSFRKIAVLRLDSIAFGVAAVACSVKLKSFQSKGLLFAGLSITAICCVIYHLWVMHALTEAFIKTIFFSLVGLGFALLIPHAEKLRAPNRFVGLMMSITSQGSYSAYLIHLPVIIPIFKTFVVPAAGGVIAYIIYIPITVILSFLTFKLLEEPVLKLRDKVVPR